MMDLAVTEDNLRNHVHILTRNIGERSVAKLWNLEKAAQYIETQYRLAGLTPRRKSYPYKKDTVSNIVADLPPEPDDAAEQYIIGAHYDSLKGTVGADDNASSVAVQLELARVLAQLSNSVARNFRLRFISFALEEPPAYASWAMGSRVYAYEAKKKKERIDGMICLEMVGFTCEAAGCQQYPFPLMFMDYPKVGNFIGIIGNYRSRKFTDGLYRSFKNNKELPVEKLTVPWSGYLVPNVRLSDHASFWDRGYRAVMITDTAFYRNPHYHRTTDTIDKLDFPFMAQLVKSLAAYFS